MVTTDPASLAIITAEILSALCAGGPLISYLRANAATQTTSRPANTIETVPRHIETHCSHVFLIGDRAFKMKKPVAFSYLDYTTLEAREHCIRAELELNRRTAPQLYLARHKIIRDVTGSFALAPAADPHPALDWLLEMQRFPDDAVLADRAGHGLLSSREMRDLADAIHDFHLQAAPRKDHGSGPEMARILKECLENLDLKLGPREPKDVARLGLAIDLHFTSIIDKVDRRQRDGRVRHCHGDLHLNNICLIEGRPVLFDCIDFSDMLACTDIAYDLAFLLMDLCHRQRADFANLVLNRWLDRNGDIDALQVLPFFQSLRGSIRAHIAATSQRYEEACGYLASALRHLEAGAPRIIALAGLSGSGKSTLAQGIAPEFLPLPGARIIRSDTLRKRLAGVSPETRLPATHYSQENSDKVYAAISTEVRQVVNAGYTAIIDAAFLKDAERQSLAELAQEIEIPFQGIWLDAPVDTLRARISARQGDASDADIAVLERQFAMQTGLITWQRLSVACTEAANLAALRAAVLSDKNARQTRL